MAEVITEPQTAAEIVESFEAPAPRGAGQQVATREATPAGGLLPTIVQLAKDPAVDVAKLQALLEMQERMEERDAKSQFNRAFIALQPKLPVVKKDGTLEYPVDKNKPDGPKRKVSSYARWENIHEEIMPLLHQHGFGMAFTTAPRQGDGGGLTVVALLKHEAGHETETPFPVPLDTSGGKNNIQGMGSALSYGKRYATIAALNIRFEGRDDDGVAAGMRFITAEQVAELDELIDRTKSDRGKYLQILGVARLENIEAGAWAAARNMLLAKVKQ